MSTAMMHETIWYDRSKYEEAEDLYHTHLSGESVSSKPAEQNTSKPAPVSAPKTQGSSSSSAKEIAEARRKIQQTLSAHPTSSSSSGLSTSDKRIAQLENENKDLRQKTEDLTEAIKKLELRVSQLESNKSVAAPSATPSAAPAKQQEKEEDSDDDVDLFGSSSEEEDEEYSKVKAERLAAYEAKKSKKPQVIAKSSILLDVKPWSDETDLGVLEQHVRTIQTDGLLWGASKLVPIAYGISKLQISCVVEDDKCGTDFLEEQITGFEDLVQSVDVAAFNKI